MKRARPIFWLIIVLMLAAMACNFISGEDEPTAVPVAATQAVQEEAAPTEAPLPTPTATPEPEPTDPPATEPPPTEAPPTEEPDEPVATSLELDTVAYAHYLGFFEVYPPAGWTMEESDGGTTFSAPDDSGYVEVEVNNTGESLDGESFERFVDAREINYFGQNDGFEIVDYQIDPDFGVARVTKEFVANGVPQTVFTYYDQYGPAIYAYDFWADSDVAEAYEPAFEELFSSSSIDFDLVAELADIYYWIYPFDGPGGLFSIKVPVSWTYVHEDEEENVIVDTFYSPDEHAIIQNITYDDGTEISRSDAGAFALALLKEVYASDIQISDDQVQPDGSERLIWRSPGSAFGGISFLETRGTTFLLFSVLWDDAYEDTYRNTLNYTIETYDVPE